MFMQYRFNTRVMARMSDYDPKYYSFDIEEMGRACEHLVNTDTKTPRIHHSTVYVDKLLISYEGAANRKNRADFTLSVCR